MLKDREYYIFNIFMQWLKYSIIATNKKKLLKLGIVIFLKNNIYIARNFHRCGTVNNLFHSHAKPC